MRCEGKSSVLNKRSNGIQVTFLSAAMIFRIHISSGLIFETQLKSLKIQWSEVTCLTQIQIKHSLGVLFRLRKFEFEGEIFNFLIVPEEWHVEEAMARDSSESSATNKYVSKEIELQSLKYPLHFLQKDTGVLTLALI